MQNRYPVKKRDLAIGTKHEMEHTKSERTARRIAREHLIRHPSYYRVLPVAEKMMDLEDQRFAKLKKRKPVRHEPNGIFFTDYSRYAV